MLVVYLFEGMVIGFLLATPVGPVGILSVRHTLAYGRRHGLVVGLGGASADAIYATIAAFGITLISEFVSSHEHLLRIAGGIFLLLVGFYTLRSSSKPWNQSNRLMLHTKVFISTFFLAITNPMTLVGYAAVFAMLGIRKALPSRVDIAALVGGILVGSFLWFTVLTSLARFFKEKLTGTGLARVNGIAGSLLVFFGVVALLGGIGAF